jgi:hypothetical protein
MGYQHHVLVIGGDNRAVSGGWGYRAEDQRRNAVAWGCSYCGTAWGQRNATGYCEKTVCLACETPQCMGNGLARGQCGFCYHGILPGWSGSNRPCGYKGCEERAVAACSRVRYACAAHIASRQPDVQRAIDNARAAYSAALAKFEEEGK